MHRDASEKGMAWMVYYIPESQFNNNNDLFNPEFSTLNVSFKV